MNVRNAMQPPRSLVLHSRLRLLFLIAIGASLIVQTLPLQRWTVHFFGPDFRPYNFCPACTPNLHVLQVIVLLTAGVLLLYTVALRRRHVASYDFFALHLFLALLALAASCLLVLLWRYATYQVPTTWSEESSYYAASNSPGLLGLYSMSNFTRPTILISIYGPFYYLVLKAHFLVFGKSILIGRIVSGACVLILALFMGIASRQKQDWFWSLVAPLLFLAIFPTMAFSGSLGKPECLAAVLSFGGVLVYLERGLTRHGPWLLWSSALCGLATVTKPSIFMGFLAIVVHLSAQKRYRECLRFVPLTLAWFVGTYAALYGPTQGGILRMTIQGNAARLLLSRILDVGVERFLIHPFTLVALLASISLLSRRANRERREGFAALYFLLALQWFLLAIGRPGGSENYFLEAAIGGCLALSFFLQQCALGRRWAYFRTALVILSLSVISQLATQLVITAREYPLRQEHARIALALSSLKAEKGELVLSSDFYSSAAIEAGLRPYVFDTFQYTLMADNNVLSTEPLLSSLRDGRIRYAILENTLDWHASLPYGSRHLPAAVVEYLKQHFDCTYVLKRGLDDRHLIICRSKPLIPRNGGK